MLLRSEPKANLKLERNMRRLSRRVAARSIGVSESLLRRAEQGGNVSAHAAKLISDFYGVPVRSWHPKLRDDE
jgi:transcriptional regulator with XRE-family HTH domain